MNQLHTCFTLRNQKGFRQLLDRAPASSSHGGQASGNSAPRSWTINSVLSGNGPPIDVNSRDALGRTVLHRACASLEPAALDYIRMLLAHPAINVNVQDSESHWTPLHRALYIGNISASILLLQRSDVDVSLKDYDGYTAFDLYNSTVEHTRPAGDGPKDLYTWGINRNAALGLNDGNDRSYPEMVTISRSSSDERRTGSAKFYPVQVRGIDMSKLHTAVITSEKRANLRLCGFGNGGRLGPGGQTTQYSLSPLQNLDNTITSIACGLDHSLAITSSGDVLSWGANRFSQLGYIVETSGTDPIQATPRKIAGALKKEVVYGVAACRMASVAWTKDRVFTWGTNGGQLGFTQSVQILPRMVTAIAEGVRSISITDIAMACLLESQEVICFWHDAHFKIGFPLHAFPSEVIPYRPPQAITRPSIVKITSCDNSFAALSALGDVFLFTLNNTSTSELDTTPGSKEKTGVKPQRVWALRKQMSAVVDVALGADGSLILCTESGHVFVRSRNVKSGNPDARRVSSNQTPAKVFKFQRVPYLQRVVKVCANSTGAFAALRTDYRPLPIAITGHTLNEDLGGVRPFVAHHLHRGMHVADSEYVTSVDDKVAALVNRNEDEDDDEDYDADAASVEKDVKVLVQLLGVFAAGNRPITPAVLQAAHGADLVVCAGKAKFALLVHRNVLVARCPRFRAVLEGQPIYDGEMTIEAKPSVGHVDITGCHPLSVLLLLQYVYTDDVPAIWDRRISGLIAEQLSSAGASPPIIKAELQILARLLCLDPLLEAAESVSKRVPRPTLRQSLGDLFEGAQGNAAAKTAPRHDIRSPLIHDVLIQLSDRDVACHSSVLRARSPFFASFLDDEEWTVKRWDSGLLVVNLKHLEWRPMSYVFKFVYNGEEEGMFDTIDFEETLDDFIDFIFLVMSCANELLIDRLILVCSAVILRHVRLTNVCSLLADATHYHAAQLKSRLQGYIAVNMECLLESRLFDDMTPELIKELSVFVQQQQEKKLPISRSNILVDVALADNADWLKLQDIPQPIVRSTKAIVAIRQSPRLSPVTNVGKLTRRSSMVQGVSPPLPSPPMKALAEGRLETEGVFSMDDETIPALSLEQSSSSVQAVPSRQPAMPWKAKTVVALEKTDLKAIMAEAENSRVVRPPLTPSPATSAPRRVIGFQPSTTSPVPPSRGVKQPWTSTSSPAPVSGLRSALANGGGASLSSSPRDDVSFPAPGSSKTAITPSTPTAPKTPTTPARRATPTRMPPSPATPTRTPSSSSHLGPVIVPTRAVSSGPPLSGRRVPSEAWTSPPPPPSFASRDSHSSSPSSSNLSFAAIQQQQRDLPVNRGKTKQSLLDIQQEETAQQAEVDFMKWWTAEEERLRLEEAQLIANANPRSRPKGPKQSGKGGGSNGKNGGGGGDRGSGRKTTQGGERLPIPGSSSGSSNRGRSGKSSGPKATPTSKP